MRTPEDTMTDIINFMLSHEEDIAGEVNDFGELKQAFEELIGRNALNVSRETILNASH